MRLCRYSHAVFRSIPLHFFLLLLSIAFLGEWMPCRASEVPSTVFILDASGSMGAKVQGKMKMDAAKEVLSGLIKDLPAGLNVGLVVYGHRQKSDCQDVEELVPLGPLDRKAMLGKIAGIQPKGMTPITYSVQKVAEGMKTLENEATIVLVSDGEETCKGDPCALVRELKASGLKFVMHVIGFDVGEKEKAQLACIAEAGGGSYFAAKNAGELTAAAKKAIRKTEESGGTLKMTAQRNGKPFRAYCEITRSGEKEEGEAAKVAEGWIEPEGTVFKILPGAYDVKVINGEDAGNPSIVLAGVVIEAGKVAARTADFSGGTLKVKALRNGKPFRAYCEIYKPVAEGEERQKAAEGWAEPEGSSFKLLPGTYDLDVQNNEDAGKPHLSFTAIVIEAGKIVEKTADFTGGTLKVKAQRNGKPFRAYCEIYKAGADQDEEKAKVDEGWADAEGGTFKLVPGVYDLKVINSDDAGHPHVTISAITVEAGKIVERVAEFTGGTLKVKALRNGKPFHAYCEIFQKDGDDESRKADEGWVEGEGTSFKLRPGVYDVKVQNSEDSDKPIVEFAGTAIEAGKVVEKVAEFSGGTIKIKSVKNGKPFRVYCELYKAAEGDEERTKLNESWIEEGGASFKVTPGIYDLVIVESETNPTKEFGKITIQPSSTESVEAQF